MEGGAGVGERAGPLVFAAGGGGGGGGGAGLARPWGSARSSPAASESGRATARSPTFLRPLESHIGGGGWGVLSK